MISHLLMISGLLFTTSSSLIMNNNNISNDIVMYADEGDAHGFVESVTGPTDGVITLPRGNVSYNTFSLFGLAPKPIKPPTGSEFILRGTFETPAYIDPITLEPLWNGFTFTFQMNFSRSHCSIGSSSPSSSNDHFSFMKCRSFSGLEVGFETSTSTGNVRFPSLVYDIFFYLSLSIDIDGNINYTLPFVTLHLNEINSLILFDDLENYVKSLNQGYTLDSFLLVLLLVLE